jgi:ribosomal protein S18 acetylase RimI-like enzyme
MVFGPEHGRAVARIVEAELDLADAATQRAIAALAAFEGSQRLGVLCAIAVAPEARLRGYAHALIDARREVLETIGCDAIYADAWIREAFHSSVGVYARLGWYPLAEIPDYWERLHAELDEPCPEASLGCDGVVYLYDAPRTAAVTMQPACVETPIALSGLRR